MVPRRLIVGAIIAAAPVVASGASLDASIGRELFERNWVSAPSSTKSNDGLGPLYNATSCAACHIRNANADIDEASVPPGTVVRIGNAKGGADPIYGRQLQTRAVANQKPEANPDITWSTTGTRREASIKLFSQGYGPLASDTKLALRRPSSLFGIGLLAQIPDREILTRADPDDANHDGISGRAPMISERRQAGARPLRMARDAIEPRRAGVDGVPCRYGPVD